MVSDAERPGVHLGQPKAIVRRAVADLLAHEGAERQLEVLPAAEVIREGVAPDLGVGGGRVRVAVVLDLEHQRRAGAVPVRPEADRPRSVLQSWLIQVSTVSFSKACVTPPQPTTLSIQLQQVGRPALAGQRQRVGLLDQRVIDRHRRAVPEVAPGDEADAQPVGVESRRQPALEVVHHVVAHHQAHVLQVVGQRTRVGQRAERPAVHFGQPEAIVGRPVADLLAHEGAEGDLHVLPAAEVIHEGIAPDLGVGGGGARVAVVLHLEEQRGAGVVPVDPEADALVAAPVLGDPGVERLIFEGMRHAAPADHVQVQLQQVGWPDLPGQRQRVGRPRSAGR